MEVVDVAESQKNIWNDFVKESGTLLQSWEWADFKANFSWRPFRLAVVENGQWLLAASILSKRLPMSKSFFYVPEGPIFSSKVKEQRVKSKDVLRALIAKIEAVAQEENAIFLRVEPFLPNCQSEIWADVINNLTGLGFRKSFEDIQPKHRLWLDLRRPEDEIWRGMKHKARYNINLARRKGVIITETNGIKMLDAFYSLYLETAKRDRFSARPKIYFLRLLKMMNQADCGRMFMAYWRKQLLSAILVTFFGKYATYLYGATSSAHRELMASYLIQWEALRKAKQRGCQIYDFGAIAPSSGPHPWSGLREFKMKFQGVQVDFPGCFDLIYKPIWYHAFQLIERIRKRENA